MAEQAREATGIEDLTVVADRGYYKSEEILRCHEAGIRAIVPKTMTSNSLADGRDDKKDFIYIAGDDEYICSAGERLIHRFTTVETGLTMAVYWSSACQQCPLRARCITATSRQRRVKRWKHAAVLDDMQTRLDRQREMMRVRRQTVEHPFGTLKCWMGATHFLTKTRLIVVVALTLNILFQLVLIVLAVTR